MPGYQILFPRESTFRMLPEPEWYLEYQAFKDAGFGCLLVDYDEILNNRIKIHGAIDLTLSTLYRGWMLTPQRYRHLEQAVVAKGARLLTSSAQYEASHHLPGWYEACRDLTPATLVLRNGDDLQQAMASVNWKRFFVKDFVKSSSTGAGSIAVTEAEVRRVIADIEHYRGDIEGGICLREVEDWVPGTEQRYFVFNGQAFSPAGAVPDLVNEVAKRLAQPFYSVDVAKHVNGRMRVVEIGDGQVSDLKEWPPSALVNAVK